MFDCVTKRGFVCEACLSVFELIINSLSVGSVFEHLAYRRRVLKEEIALAQGVTL